MPQLIIFFDMRGTAESQRCTSDAALTRTLCDRQESEAIFERMRVLGFIPNRFSYVSLMKTLLEEKQFRRVLSLGMEMRELQIETNDIIKKLIAAAETGLGEETREQLQLSTQV